MKIRLFFIALKLIPKEIIDECKEQAKDLWKDGKPKKMALCHTNNNNLVIGYLYCSEKYFF